MKRLFKYLDEVVDWLAVLAGRLAALWLILSAWLWIWPVPDNPEVLLSEATTTDLISCFFAAIVGVAITYSIFMRDDK